MNCSGYDPFVHYFWGAFFPPRVILLLQGDWRLSCDHGLIYVNYCENYKNTIRRYALTESRHVKPNNICRNCNEIEGAKAETVSHIHYLVNGDLGNKRKALLSKVFLSS